MSEVYYNLNQWRHFWEIKKIIFIFFVYTKKWKKNFFFSKNLYGYLDLLNNILNSAKWCNFLLKSGLLGNLSNWSMTKKDYLLRIYSAKSWISRIYSF